jgi:arabinan endo-1,5-alpha-L-arabinosidase
MPRLCSVGDLKRRRKIKSLLARFHFGRWEIKAIMAVILTGTLVSTLLVLTTVRSGSDSIPPAPANPNAPGLILDPQSTRPDPTIVWDADTSVYRMYTTQTIFGFTPEWVSHKVTGPWHWVGDSLLKPPTWSDQSIWAPDVEKINGVWTMWESALVTGTRSFCIYRATSKSAIGPFKVDPRRFPCDTSVGGNLDPQTIRDNSGGWWLIFKFNGNATGRPTVIHGIRIGPDGWPFGHAYTLMTSTQTWESGQIEAPSLVQDPSSHRWWLVFSAGDASPDHPTYGVAAAPCEGVRGPCDIGSVVHLVGNNQQGMSPGEESVLADTNGDVWMAYNSSGPFINPALRPLALARLVFDLKGIPYLSTPTPGT